MSNETQAIVGAISSVSSYLPSFLSLLPSSIYSYFTLKPFQTINFLLQAILFSSSILNLVSALILIIGLKQAVSLLSHRYIFILLSVLFISLHAWQFSDNHKYVHEVLKYLSGFYVCLCVVQGCYYVKHRIDKYDDPHTLQHSSNPSAQGIPNHSHIIAIPMRHNTSTIIKQLLLIIITLASTLFFIFIWYNIKVSKQLPYLHNDYKTIGILIISTIAVYVISILKHVSLFMPAIICCLCVYLTMVVRVGLDLLVYSHDKHMQALGLPFQAMILLLLAVQGKQRHKNQISAYRHRVASKNIHVYDRQHIQEYVKADKLLVDHLFWACCMYYLYGIVHGCTIRMEYMIVPVYIIMVYTNAIH